MLKGFFDISEVRSKSRPGGKVYSCVSCGLHKHCVNPKMEAQGKFKKRIMIVGDAPGDADDESGRLWRSPYGRFLSKELSNFGIDVVQDCISVTALKCKPKKKTKKTEISDSILTYEVDCCRKFVLEAINTYKPHLIILLGDYAVYSVIGGRWKHDLDDIKKWRGWTIPDQDYKAWICPTYSPEAVMRADKKEITNVWRKDLGRALACIDQKIPEYIEPEIRYIENLKELDHIHTEFAFDYETTGLKPHSKGHEIICASVCYDPNKVYAFMMPPDEKSRQPFLNKLRDPNIRKIAQNMKFEDTWTSVILGIKVQNWYWDTMLASHILDNRENVTGLKFQTYVNFGVIDYDSHINPYLRAVDSKNANAFNTIKDLLRDPQLSMDLLKYCALDSVYEYRLSEIQRPLILTDDLPF